MAGLTVLARLMETQIWHPPAGSVEGVFSKGTMASANTSDQEKAAPLAPVLIPDNLVPPFTSLVPFELLHQ